MKSVFTRTVSVEVANALVEEIQIVTDLRYKEYLAHRITNEMCEVFDMANGAIGLEPDGMARMNPIGFRRSDSDIFEARGAAISGDHVLSINITTGLLMVSHDGAHGSYPGNLLDHVLQYTCWQSLSAIEDWNKVIYQTSEPTWALVAGLLTGHIGNGPLDRYDADRRYQAKFSKEYRMIRGYEVPKDLWYDKGCFWTSSSCDAEVWSPRWTGLDYRRANALGIVLK